MDFQGFVRGATFFEEFLRMKAKMLLLRVCIYLGMGLGRCSKDYAHGRDGTLYHYYRPCFDTSKNNRSIFSSMIILPYSLVTKVAQELGNQGEKFAAQPGLSCLPA